MIHDQSRSGQFRNCVYSSSNMYLSLSWTALKLKKGWQLYLDSRIKRLDDDASSVYVILVGCDNEYWLFTADV
jgi:hypothetical protein